MFNRTFFAIDGPEWRLQRTVSYSTRSARPQNAPFNTSFRLNAMPFPVYAVLAKYICYGESQGLNPRCHQQDKHRVVAHNWEACGRMS